MQILRERWITAGVVGALVVVFGVLSVTAIRGKSATQDEPLHVVGALVHRYRHDYRINPEDPALFGWWASLPLSSSALPLDQADDFFKASAGDVNEQWKYVVRVMYAKDAAKADAVLNRSRAMFVLLGMALAVLVATWAYQLAGKWAAIAAAALICLDPNWLAHSGIVKNDVPLSLLMSAMAYAVWQFGRNGKWYAFAAAAVLGGLAVNVKYSGVLCGPLLVMLLVCRAMLGQTWIVAGIPFQSRGTRAVVAIVGAVVTSIVIWILIWTAYGFRFSATADGTPLNTQSWFEMSVITGIRAELDEADGPEIPKPQLMWEAAKRIQDGQVALPVQLDLALLKARLLPEGWLFGFLYTYTNTLLRSSYLLGDTRLTGWWYYFPATILFKTPTTTAVLTLVSLVAIAPCLRRMIAEKVDWPWSAICLSVVPAIYLATAMTAHLNLGLRHILPIYPFIFIAVGVSFSLLIRRWRTPTLFFGSIGAICLLTETLCAYPNYIAYFNLPSGGTRGGMALLSGSNLDWGQDLPALAAWRKQHPDGTLYLAYFGTAKPAAYGIDCINLRGGWEYDGIGEVTGPGVLAISATNVQRNFWGPRRVEQYVQLLEPQAAQAIRNDLNLNDKQRQNAFANVLRAVRPREILEGTIYLYDVGPKNDDSRQTPSP